MNVKQSSRAYGIGELSRETGVNIETIRYYERIGITPKPDRSAGGNRQYSMDDLKRLSFVKRARGLGFSLGEIRGLFGMVDDQSSTCKQVHDLTMTHLHVVRDKINALQEMERALSDMVAQCGQGNVPDCPIIDAMFGI